MSESDFTGVPLRLYLNLEQGHTADLVPLSQASIAFANGVREIAYLLDPTLNLRIGLTPQKRGSLWQNTLLAAQEEYQDRKILYQLAAASMLWFVQPPLEKMRDGWWEPKLEQFPDFSESEKKNVRRVSGPDVAEGHRQDGYKWLNRDNNINGVGVTTETRKPPRELIVPRSEFGVRSGREAVVSTELDRTTTGPLHVILVSPVLDMGTRRWKFATAQGEFGAAIKDEQFLTQMIAGNLTVPLRAGIELDVQLETKERLINGVWQVVERNVIEVEGLSAPVGESQISLFPTDGSGNK